MRLPFRLAAFEQQCQQQYQDAAGQDPYPDRQGGDEVRVGDLALRHRSAGHGDGGRFDCLRRCSGGSGRCGFPHVGLCGGRRCGCALSGQAAGLHDRLQRGYLLILEFQQGLHLFHLGLQIGDLLADLVLFEFLAAQLLLAQQQFALHGLAIGGFPLRASDRIFRRRQDLELGFGALCRLHRLPCDACWRFLLGDGSGRRFGPLPGRCSSDGLAGLPRLHLAAELPERIALAYAAHLLVAGDREQAARLDLVDVAMREGARVGALQGDHHLVVADVTRTQRLGDGPQGVPRPHPVALRACRCRSVVRGRRGRKAVLRLRQGLRGGGAGRTRATPRGIQQQGDLLDQFQPAGPDLEWELEIGLFDGIRGGGVDHHLAVFLFHHQLESGRNIGPCDIELFEFLGTGDLGLDVLDQHPAGAVQADLRVQRLCEIGVQRGRAYGQGLCQGRGQQTDAKATGDPGSFNQCHRRQCPSLNKGICRRDSAA